MQQGNSLAESASSRYFGKHWPFPLQKLEPSDNESYRQENYQEQACNFATGVPIAAQFVLKGDVSCEERSHEDDNNHDTQHCQAPGEVKGENEQADNVERYFGNEAQDSVWIFQILNAQAFECVAKFVCH